jgi:hypothetical protein
MRKSIQEIFRTSIISGVDEHRAWILEATDDELDEYILLISGNALLYPMAIAERQKRHFKHLSKPVEPHWTILPAYRLLQTTVVLMVLAIIVTVLTWWFPRSVVQEPIPHDSNAHSNSAISIYIPTPVLAPTNLPPTKAAIEQTQSAAIYTMPHTNILGH